MAKLIGLTPETAARLKQLLGKDTTPPPPARRGGGGGGGGGSRVVKGTLDGALSYGGSATLSVRKWDGSTEADTGENVTVYDFLMTTGQSIAAGTQVFAAQEQSTGRYYLLNASNTFDIVTEWTIDDSVSPCVLVPSKVRTVSVLAVGAEHTP